MHKNQGSKNLLWPIIIKFIDSSKFIIGYIENKQDIRFVVKNCDANGKFPIFFSLFNVFVQ